MPSLDGPGQRSQFFDAEDQQKQCRMNAPADPIKERIGAAGAGCWRVRILLSGAKSGCGMNGGMQGPKNVETQAYTPSTITPR